MSGNNAGPDGMAMNQTIPDQEAAARRRGVRRTAFAAGLVAVLIYAAFLAGLIGR